MKKIHWSQKLGVGFVLACFSVYGIARATSSVSLLWNANLDPSVAGYNVYYGGASRAYTNSFSAGDVTNATVGGLVEGKTYYFAVTAYDTVGNESDFSDETVYLVPGLMVATPGINPGDPIRIQFPVAPAHWYELQASSDMQNWTTVWQTVGVSNNWVEYDTPVSSTGAQFFRVVLH